MHKRTLMHTIKSTHMLSYWHMLGGNEVYLKLSCTYRLIVGGKILRSCLQFSLHTEWTAFDPLFLHHISTELGSEQTVIDKRGSKRDVETGVICRTIISKGETISAYVCFKLNTIRRDCCYSFFFFLTHRSSELIHINMTCNKRRKIRIMNVILH